MLPGFPPRRPAPDADVSLEELSAVVIDFETTGLYANQGDEIIELGGMYVNGFEIESTKIFDRLVNPCRPVSEAAYRVHHIPDSMLAVQPPIPAVLPSFVEFLQDRWVVGQNVVFDLSFLAKALRRCGMPLIQNPIIDTKWLSKLAFPRMTHHSLDAIAERLGLERPVDRHRAMGDVQFTAEILVRLMKKLHERGFQRIGDVLEAHERAEGGCFGAGEVLIVLERSFQDRLIVELAYMGNSEHEVVKRRVSIYHLSPPYIIGFCHSRNAIRTFRVDRVAGVETLQDVYGIPAEFHPQDHFLRR